jgi:hypothetical protein
MIFDKSQDGHKIHNQEKIEKNMNILKLKLKRKLGHISRQHIDQVQQSVVGDEGKLSIMGYLYKRSIKKSMLKNKFRIQLMGLFVYLALCGNLRTDQIHCNSISRSGIEINREKEAEIETNDKVIEKLPIFDHNRRVK